MTLYQCAAGKTTNVNTFCFNIPPKIIKLKGSWYFQECISCNKKTSTDYYFIAGTAFSENTIECEGYCKLLRDYDAEEKADEDYEET